MLALKHCQAVDRHQAFFVEMSDALQLLLQELELIGFCLCLDLEAVNRVQDLLFAALELFLATNA